MNPIDLVCERCGCSGLHACIGRMTTEEDRHWRDEKGNILTEDEVTAIFRKVFKQDILTNSKDI